MCGKVNLQVSAQLIHFSNRVITGDTGMMHIAAAYQKQIVTLWGNTIPEFGMYPFYGSKNKKKNTNLEVTGLSCRPCSKLGYDKCPKGHFKCMMASFFSLPCRMPCSSVVKTCTEFAIATVRIMVIDETEGPVNGKPI